jgi:hypothetical protein
MRNKIVEKCKSKLVLAKLNRIAAEIAINLKWFQIF